MIIFQYNIAIKEYVFLILFTQFSSTYNLY